MSPDFDWLLKPTKKKEEYRIMSSPLLIEDKKYSLLIGQFPRDIIKNGGNPIQSDKSLSIENFLRELKVRSIAQEVFPWAHSSNSHWIYYALFNGTYSWNRTLKRDNKIVKLKIALKYLDSLGKRNSGAARRLKESDGKKKWANIFDSAISSHRISHPTKSQSNLFKSLRKKINNEEEITKNEKSTFNKMWISQSNHLTGKIASKNISIGQWIANGSNMTDSVYKISYRYKHLGRELITLLAAFLTIRAIYGESLDHDQNEMTSAAVKKAAIEAIKLFDHIEYESPNFGPIKEDLKYAKKTGVPRRRGEAKRIAEEKRIQLFKTFRLQSFLKIVRQLDEE